MTRALACLLLTAVAFAVAAPVPADDAKFDGFVQLFNGKDLTGWKPHPGNKDCKWEVVDGAITASGEKAGHLFSERGDYTDFVYRMEAKINDVGNSGQYFRAKFEAGFPPGYEAQINFGHKDTIKTGSLYPAFNRRLRGDAREKLLVKKAPHAAEEWFTQEVTAVGNHITIKVNGQQTVDFVDDSNAFTQGHFAIQYHDPTCKIRVRKVEVKELKTTK
jgi:3-keto-disaccharide hydrolase